MLSVSKDYTLIIDYAHNEVSTRSVLTTLMEYHPKRLICTAAAAIAPNSADMIWVR